MIFCVMKLCCFRTIFYFLVICICSSNEIQFSQVQFVLIHWVKSFREGIFFINVDMIRPKNITVITEYLFIMIIAKMDSHIF